MNTRAGDGDKWLTINPQCLSLWCWASVAEFLHLIFRTQEPEICQEAVASRILRKVCADACPKAGTHDCDEIESLCYVLREEGLLVEEVVIEDSLQEHLSTIKDEVLAGRPVCVLLPASGGHFVAVTDWLEADDRVYLEIMDPAGGFVKYMPAGRLVASGYSCRGFPGRFYLTNRASSERSPECDGEDRLGPRISFTGALWAEALDEVDQETLSKVTYSVPELPQRDLNANLDSLRSLGQKAPPPIQVRSIRVEPGIKLLSIQTELEAEFVALEICSRYGYPLIDSESEKPVGLVELVDDGDKVRFDALTLAPGDQGDRYAAKILQANRNLQPVVIRILNRYEHAILYLRPGEFVGSRVNRFEDGFGFSGEGLALDELAAELVRRVGEWG